MRCHSKADTEIYKSGRARREFEDFIINMMDAKEQKQFRALGVEVMSIYLVPIYLGLAI